MDIKEVAKRVRRELGGKHKGFYNLTDHEIINEAILITAKRYEKALGSLMYRLRTMRLKKKHIKGWKLDKGDIVINNSVFRKLRRQYLTEEQIKEGMK